MIIYHIVKPTYWANFHQKTIYTPLKFEQEGFIHCCFEEQFHHVLSNYFKDESTVLRLKIDTALLNAPLKVESANEKDYFPHIYGALNKTAVTSIESLDLLEK